MNYLQNLAALTHLTFALSVIFPVLKLTGLVDWSWWFVLSPLACTVLLNVSIRWGLRQWVQRRVSSQLDDIMQAAKQERNRWR